MPFTGGTNGYAAGAESNTSAVDYALETTYNTPPTGAFQALRYTDVSLAVNETDTQPDEINDIPEMAQSVLTGRTTQGSISGILSVGTFEDLLAGVMSADWNNITFTSSGNSSSSGSFIQWIAAANVDSYTGYKFVALPTNQPLAQLPATGLVLLNDPTNGINNVLVPYSKFPARSYGVYVPNAAYSLAGDKVATTGATAVFSGITNGSLGKTFTFRQKMADAWQIFSGTMVNQIEISLQKGQAPTISIDLIGSDMTTSDTDIAASVRSRTSTPLIDTVEGFLGCTIFGNAPAGCIQSATITLSRDGSGQDTGMGHTGACGVRFGSFKAAMEITYFFKDYQQFTDWKNGNTGPVSIGVQGSDGQGYQFTVLNGIIRNPKTPISGKNTTVVATVSVTANPMPMGGTFAIARTSS